MKAMHVETGSCQTGQLPVSFIPHFSVLPYIP